MTSCRLGYHRLMNGRRGLYWFACGGGRAGLGDITIVRGTAAGGPPRARGAAPRVAVLLIAYDIWYRRTKSSASDER